MRNISFMLTTEQVRNRSKTVTRRLGWKNLKPGDRLQGCVKCMGLKRGEKLQKLAVIEVVSARQEPLAAMTDDDCTKEGFPQFDDAAQFIAMFCEHMRVDPTVNITRIEFKYVE